MDMMWIEPEAVLKDMASQLVPYRNKAIEERRPERVDGSPYFSLYALSKNEIAMGVLDGRLNEVYHNWECPVLATVHYHSAEPGYGYGESIDRKRVHRAIHTAEAEAWSNCHDFQGSTQVETPLFMKHPGYVSQGSFKQHVPLPKSVQPFTDVSRQQLEELLREVEGRLSGHRGIIGSEAYINIEVGNEVFYDSFDTQISQQFSRWVLRMTARAHASDLPPRYFEQMGNIGAFGGYELLDKSSETSLYHDIMRAADDIAQKTVMFANTPHDFESVGISTGRVDMVFDGRAGATCIHEMGAGHMVEATGILNGNGSEAFRDKFRKPVNTRIDNLTIIDHCPEVPLNGKSIVPPSYYAYDAEGTQARRTQIVHDSKFFSLLTTRLTAGSLKRNEGTQALTGNARVSELVKEDDDEEDVPNAPQSRMSTLWIEPSKEKCILEDLLGGCIGGLYITGLSTDGQVDTDTGQGSCVVSEVYYIKSKKELIPLRTKGYEIGVNGDVQSFMGLIDRIGDESTTSIDSKWCESDNGELVHCCGGASFRVRGAVITIKKLDAPIKKPFIPLS